jgi:AraC-like DNA-binding protein
MIKHEIRVSSAATVRTLLIRSTASASLPMKCCIIEVSPLQRELTLRAVTLTERADALDDNLVQLILNEMRSVRVPPLQIAFPTDLRALKVCRALMKNPADARTCSQWGTTVGASARTLQRLFRSETGVSFGAWRQQARLLEALNRLAARAPVSNVASELGYQSPSAFSAMFKRIFGRAPRQFFQQYDIAHSTGT